MGVAKAGLEAVTRYLARDLGPKGIRVNTVAAGPLRPWPARASPGSTRTRMGGRGERRSGWDTTDPTPVGETMAFLLSDLSAGITGELIRVDGGFHAMGTDLFPE